MNRVFWIILFCLQAAIANANELISPQCRSFVEIESVEEQKVVNSNGILWQIGQDGNTLGYVFGTIHVSDIEITTLPEPVSEALIESRHFAMEALPEPEALLLFSKKMFFQDETRLNDFVDKAIINRIKEILANYNVNAAMVNIMKPWSAFLTMNYPPDTGMPLDLVLLNKAMDVEAETYGLETLQEQADIFDSLSLKEQTRLLIDTVCNYDAVEADFIALKSFYLERDLAGLYNYVNRYSTMHEPLYKKLMHRLIDKRNKLMVERMIPLLQQGNAFIAIGTMHLPGEKGVLALLEEQGYHLSAIY
ncbi:MAG: TraB/GumN family protein [Pseudomonadota bacterium]